MPTGQNTTNIRNNLSGAVGSAFNTSRPRIYPREYNNRNLHLSTTTSPLLSAIQNPSELISRSIPFPPFLSASPSSGAPNSLGSAAGGVGFNGASSTPPSAPASYSSGGAGGFSAPRQARGYPGFEEQYSGSNGSTGTTYHNTAQRNPHGSSVPSAEQLNGSHFYIGEANYACELATVDELGLQGGNTRISSGAIAGGDNVVCLGSNGGVDIWRIGRSIVEQVGHLEGLRGYVKTAKILPNPPLNDHLAAHRPLICLTIHSPIAPDSGSSDADHGLGHLLDADSPYSKSPPSRPQTSASHHSSQNGYDMSSDWQTTVEVWSLTTKTRLARLFTSPVVPFTDAGFCVPTPPSPWGNLKVQVSANRVVVGVGSGELYVFGIECSLKSGEKDKEIAEWKCLDKIWTCVQFSSGQSFSADGGSTATFDGKTPIFGAGSVGTPVFALSDRWLAYCPASTGSFSAGGEVCVSSVSVAVSSQTPPSQPSISAAVSLEDEAFLNRMAREVTQEVIRGAKWAADAGYKRFQNYWNGGSQQNGNSSSPPQSMPIGIGANGSTQSVGGTLGGSQPGGHPQPSGLGQQLRQMQQTAGLPLQFQQSYPSHQHHEPRLVSIVDLQKSAASFQHNHTPPMATFLPPAGVSFLSFAPGGLSLLSASSKGDLLFVWDLLKVVHHPTGSISLGHQRSSSGSGPSVSKSMNNNDGLGRHVRQIARFTRITVATIIDVDWSSPRGEKIAVVTERGTVHFYDLPSGALQWPPPRRPPPSSTAVSAQTTTAGAAVSGAVNLFNSSTQPLLTAARRRRSRSSSVGSPGGGIFSSPSMGRRGSAVAGTSPNDPPVGGSKIPLPASGSCIAPGCVKFLTSKESGYVAVIGGGLLRIYELRPGGSGKKGSKTGGVASGNWWEYDLPRATTASEQAVNELPEEKALGFWGLRSHWGRSTEEDGVIAEGGFWKTPLAWAEIETNSAFVPWHQERRVKMFVYEPPPKSLQNTTGFKVETPSMITHASMLSPNPINWDAREESDSRSETPSIAIYGTSPGQTPKKRENTPPSSAASSPNHSPKVPDLLPEPETQALSDLINSISSTSNLPPQSQPTFSSSVSCVAEKWVFGGPIEAERIFLSDAGGRGDVTFGGEGQSGLEVAMRDGLDLDGISSSASMGFSNRAGTKAIGTGVGIQEGFFEEDAEVLDFA